MTGTEQFIASLVHSLAWPAAAFGAAALFRQQLRELLSRSLRRVKAGPVEFEFDRVLSEVEANLGREPPLEVPATPQLATLDDLVSVARTSPSAAVLDAHARLEHELWELTKSVIPEGSRPQGAVGLARLARAENLITPETEEAVVGVTTLRNLAAHGRQADVSVERAVDYLALVDAVLYPIRQRRERAA